jgi:DNA-binding transcriptional LysR family regulator
VAQQALSRDIRRLGDLIGGPLFERTTRRVSLTPAGEHLLESAHQLLALHDQTRQELRGDTRSLSIDLVGPDLTPTRLLIVARARAPEVEFFARFHGGLQTALAQLATHGLDVTFGRLASPGTAAPDGIAYRLVRLERIAVLLPEGHPLAELAAVPLSALRDAAVCWRAGNHVTPEWEQAALQLLAGFDIDPTQAHPRVHGLDELALHVRRRDAPVLTVASQPHVSSAVVRPLVEPTAVYPWYVIWRRDFRHPGQQALHQAIDELAATERWLELPDNAWLPQPEARSIRPSSTHRGQDGHKDALGHAVADLGDRTPER